MVILQLEKSSRQRGEKEKKVPNKFIFSILITGEVMLRQDNANELVVYSVCLVLLNSTNSDRENYGLSLCVSEDSRDESDAEVEHIQEVFNALRQTPEFRAHFQYTPSTEDFKLNNSHIRDLRKRYSLIFEINEMSYFIIVIDNPWMARIDTGHFIWC